MHNRKGTIQMGSKLFVGGLAWATNNDSLRDHFQSFGEVVDSKVITERDTGRSRGFGFVTYADDESAAKAKEELHNSELDGRTIRVDFATDQRDRKNDRRGGGDRW